MAYQSNHPVAGNEKIAIGGDSTLEEAVELGRNILIQLHRILIPGGAIYMFSGGGGPRPVMESFGMMIQKLNGIKCVNTIIWDKIRPGSGWRYRFGWEPIFEMVTLPEGETEPKFAIWNGRPTEMNVLRYHRVIPSVSEHPTKKPIPLLRHLIRNASMPNDIVIDPTAGECSTAVAAKMEGRRFVAIEMEDVWWQRGCEMVAGTKEQMSFSFQPPATGIDFVRFGNEQKRNTLFTAEDTEQRDTTAD